MMKLSLEQKACRVIEVLVSDDFCEDLEFKVGVHNDCTLKPDEVRLVDKKISKIYMFTHAANGHSCFKSHENWVAELERTYIKFRKMGYFKGLNKNKKELN